MERPRGFARTYCLVSPSVFALCCCAHTVDAHINQASCHPFAVGGRSQVRSGSPDSAKTAPHCMRTAGTFKLHQSLYSQMESDLEATADTEHGRDVQDFT